MIVRPARLDELSALCIAVAPQKLLTHYEITSTRLAQLLAEAIGRGEPVAVVDDGTRAVGFAWFLYSGTLGVGGYLRLIALAPGTEGQGAGGVLLSFVEREVAQRAKHMFLLVSHWNDGARRFYARRGYVEVGRLPAFVRADTDEIICWKRLPAP